MHHLQYHKYYLLVFQVTFQSQLYNIIMMQDFFKIPVFYLLVILNNKKFL